MRVALPYFILRTKMDTLEALVLGLIQGLTEYLPVSSSGHLAIGSAIFDVDPDKT